MNDLIWVGNTLLPRGEVILAAAIIVLVVSTAVALLLQHSGGEK